MKLTKIFEPITINKTEFKNRMVVSVGDCHERAKNGYRGIQEGYEAGIRI